MKELDPQPFVNEELREVTPDISMDMIDVFERRTMEFNDRLARGDCRTREESEIARTISDEDNEYQMLSSKFTAAKTILILSGKEYTTIPISRNEMRMLHNIVGGIAHEEKTSSVDNIDVGKYLFMEFLELFKDAGGTMSGFGHDAVTAGFEQIFNEAPEVTNVRRTCRRSLREQAQRNPIWTKRFKLQPPQFPGSSRKVA